MTTNTASFRVPLGLADTGELVDPAAADRAQTYRCPGCGEALLLKAGKIRVRHFSHPADTACSGESVLHALAKIAVAQAIDRAHAGSGPPIEIGERCTGCEAVLLKTLPRHALTGTRIEEAVGAYRCDLVGLRGETPVLAIEIKATHGVDDAKAEGLAALGLPLIELDAKNALAAPHDWTSALRTRFLRRSPACPGCCHRAQSEAAILVELGLEAPLALAAAVARRHAGWRWFGQTCPRCNSSTLDFECETEAQPSWMPPVVRLISPAGRSPFWASHCHHCSAIIGPFRLIRAAGVGSTACVLATPDPEQPPIEETGAMQRWVRRVWAAWDGTGCPPSFNTAPLPNLLGAPDEIAPALALRREVASREPWRAELRDRREASYWIQSYGRKPSRR